MNQFKEPRQNKLLSVISLKDFTACDIPISLGTLNTHMMYNKQDLHGNTGLYPRMSQLYMVVDFQMFTASNNLEGVHAALRICCTDRVCVCVCARVCRLCE